MKEGGSMEDLSGKQLGSYQIVAPLGEGGMAAVYKAYQPAMERYVAVKILPRHMASSDEFLARFRREAKLVAQLQHPHILPVFDYGEADGYPYIVMPFVHVGTLADLLQKQRLSFTEIRRIATQIGEALSYAHGHGMIHRDIKPSNVLIDESGNCLLTDFGLARMAEAVTKLTTSGTVMGTPAYMSPEQGAGSITDHRSDIYSLGIILYEMVTGRVPYVAETPVAVVFKHIQDPLPSARKLNPSLPEALELVLLKTLAKSPDDRYQTASEFVRAVQNAIPQTLTAEQATIHAATPQGATVVSRPEPATVSADILKPPRALVKYSLLGISSLLILIAGIWGVSFFARRPQTPERPESISTATQGLPPVPAATKPIAEKPIPTKPIPAAEVDCSKPETFCVGLVTDVGKINDRSFNQSAWEGVQMAEKNLGAHIQFIETTDSKDYAKNIAIFGDAHYDVIVTVGFAFGEATDTVAPRYPDIKFVGVDQFQSQTVNNVGGLTFPEDNAGFLVGALAAMMSKSHKIGAVCGTDAVPPVWRFGEGYRAGAAYADKANGIHTDVFIVYHNDVGFDKTFTDPEWGAVTAKSMLDQGVDVIFGCGGITGNGALTAAAHGGAYVIGVDTDQYFTLPEAAPRMLSSALKMMAPGVFDLILKAKQGTFPVGNYLGTAGFAPFHELESIVPQHVKDQMERIMRGLLDGSIKTNVPPAKP